MRRSPKKGTKSFDLRENPLVVLGLEPSASLEKIADAYDDAIADQIASESDLTTAREALVNPRQRLAAELSFLFEAPPGQVKVISSALRGQASPDDLVHAADRLAPLSKANLITHVVARHPANGDQLFALVDPSLNLPVGGFRIHASNLEAGDIIRRGDPVIIHWSIDENGLLNCKLEFPNISQTYDTGKMYVSADGHKNYDGDTGQRLASEALANARDDVDGLERALGSDVAEEILKIRSRLAEQRDTLKLATDSDTRRAVSEEGRMIRQEVARIKSKPEFVRASLRSDIDQFVEGFALSVSSVIEAKVNTQIQRLAGMAREALSRNSPHAVDDARRSYDEIRGLLFGALAKLPGFWLARFEALAEDRHIAVDKELHDQLTKKGETAIQNNDVDALRDITFRLTENQVQSVKPSGGDILSGLTRD